MRDWSHVTVRIDNSHGRKRMQSMIAAYFSKHHAAAPLETLKNSSVVKLIPQKC